ncbi:MAG TPA: CaiB/BaiF CoA-transferase family protein [Jatrophihabitans sp.]|nr:CaiB/BaiF CoA-transferase family protein [Jatrophihabitans sp.]
MTSDVSAGAMDEAEGDAGPANLPLAGITVVSLEQAVAAPYATRQLADLGCRVIKIERPGTGDFARRYDESVRGMSSYFVWANRSKESICLDVKDPDGLAVLVRLIETADVFVQNLAPKASARLGLDATTLRERRPELIVCDVSGYGARGPWSHRKAYDLLVQSEAGVLSLTGTADATARVGVSIADIAAGMYAFSGILAALLRRQSTGCGSVVEVSLFDSLSEWVGQPLYYTKYAGEQPARTGTHHPTIAPYGPFECRDGLSVLVAVQNEREWATFCTSILGEPSLAVDERFRGNPARVRNRDELHRIIAAAIAGFDSTEALARLDAIGIANARQNTVVELLDHPALLNRDRYRHFGSPVGQLSGPISPISLSGVTPRMDAVPDIGEHTDAILQELGYTSADREELRQRGVI